MKSSPASATNALVAATTVGLACEPSYRAVVAPSLFTGLRKSEALGLVWRDVDLEAADGKLAYLIRRVPRPAQPQVLARLPRAGFPRWPAAFSDQGGGGVFLLCDQRCRLERFAE
jgi:integrase